MWPDTSRLVQDGAGNAVDFTMQGATASFGPPIGNATCAAGAGAACNVTGIHLVFAVWWLHRRVKGSDPVACDSGGLSYKPVSTMMQIGRLCVKGVEMHRFENDSAYTVDAVDQAPCALAGRVFDGQPRDGCAPLHSSEGTRGGIAILERGQCMFAAKVCPACWMASTTCLCARREGTLLWISAGH